MTKPDWLTFNSIYAFLFVLSGAVIAIYVLFDLRDAFRTTDDYGSLGDFYLWAFFFLILFSSLHQYNIYNGLHLIESDQDIWSKDTGKWAGSKWEKVLRFTILLVILGAFSKGTPLFDAISLLDRIPCFTGDNWIAYIRHLGEPENKIAVYLSLISMTFALFVIWSGLAVWYVNTDEGTEAADKKSRTKELAVWMISDFLAFLIWLLITLNRTAGAPPVTLAIVLVFILLYILLIIYRFIVPAFKKKRSMIVGEEHIGDTP